jgi:hypothetical protein
LTRWFTQDWATLRCKTLLLLCGGLPREEDEDELVQVRVASGELNGRRIGSDRIGSGRGPSLRWRLAYIYSGLGPLPS